MKKRLSLNGIGCSRKGKMTPEVGSQNLEDRCKFGQNTNFGAIRLKNRCETTSKRMLRESEEEKARTLAREVDSPI
jgi:hypothetical protein